MNIIPYICIVNKTNEIIMATSSRILVIIDDKDINQEKRFDVEKLLDTKILCCDSVMSKPLPHQYVMLDSGIISTYIKYDGDISCVGQMLINFFNNYDDALNLVLGGEIQSLYTMYTPYIVYDGWTDHIRPKLSLPSINKDYSREIENYHESFNYVFVNNEWIYSKFNSPTVFHSLKEDLDDYHKKMYNLRHNL